MSFEIFGRIVHLQFALDQEQRKFAAMLRADSSDRASFAEGGADVLEEPG